MCQQPRTNNCAAHPPQYANADGRGAKHQPPQRIMRGEADRRQHRNECKRRTDRDLRVHSALPNEPRRDDYASAKRDQPVQQAGCLANSSGMPPAGLIDRGRDIWLLHRTTPGITGFRGSRAAAHVASRHRERDADTDGAAHSNPPSRHTALASLPSHAMGTTPEARTLIRTATSDDGAPTYVETCPHQASS